MLPILIAGAIGFYYLYSCWLRIGLDFFRKNVQQVVGQLRLDLSFVDGVHVAKPNEEMLEKAKKRLRSRSGIVARELHKALEVAMETPAAFEEYMQVRMIETLRHMQKGAHIVTVMAAAAPLLGLLGTVTGMVATFDVITLYGNQNPVLMADGISEALISTQSGLLVAFPLTLLKQRLDERIDLLSEQLQLGATIIEMKVASL